MSVTTPNDKHIDLILPTYLEWQYTRIGQLEEHGLAVSGAVIVLSVGVLTLLNQSDSGVMGVMSLAQKAALWLALVANIAAAFYIRRVEKGQDIHEKRALHVLELYADSLLHVNEKHTFSLRIRPFLQALVHLVVALTIIYLLMYI